MATVDFTPYGVASVEEDADYFGDYSHISNTSLGWFIDSPELYSGIVTGKFPAPDSEAFAFGHAVHSMILLNEPLSKVAVEIPVSVLNADGHRKGANWKAFAARNQQTEFESLQQVVSELRRFLHEPLAHARSMEPFAAKWSPRGLWA